MLHSLAMKKIVAMTFLAAITAICIAQSPVGAWNGKLQIDQSTIPKAQNAEQKKMIDGMIAQVKAATLKLSMKANRTFTILVPSIGGQKAQNAEGTWTQKGRTVTLVTTKQNGKAPKETRPQKMLMDASGRKMTLVASGPEKVKIIFTR